MRKVCSLGVHASRGPTHTSGACCRAPLTACVQAQVQRLCSKYAVTANHFRQFQNAGPINRSDMASGLRNFQRIIAVNLQRVCKVASLRTQKFRGFTIPRQFRDEHLFDFWTHRLFEYFDMHSAITFHSVACSCARFARSVRPQRGELFRCMQANSDMASPRR